MSSHALCTVIVFTLYTQVPLEEYKMDLDIVDVSTDIQRIAAKNRCGLIYTLVRNFPSYNIRYKNPLFRVRSIVNSNKCTNLIVLTSLRFHQKK